MTKGSHRRRQRLTPALALLAALLLLVVAAGARAQGPGTDNLTDDGLSYPVSWRPDGSGLLITRLSGKVQIAAGWQLLTDLWQVDLSGHQTLLAQNASYPVLSPDGSSVAYLSFNGSDQADLHLFDLNTGRSRQIAQADWGHSLQWSPVGQGVIFVRDGRPRLVGRDGGNARPLAGDLTGTSFQFSPAGDRWAAKADDGLRLIRPGRPPVLLAPGQPVSGFAWSPSGDRLAYVLEGQLWTASADGLAQRKLLETGGEYLGPPRWSPDGSQIAFVRTSLRAGSPEESRLWIVSEDGGEGRGVAADIPVDDSPLWSPDGRWLAFASQGNVVIADANAPSSAPGSTIPETGSRIPPPLPATGPPALALGQQLTPPPTIRVLHHPNNTCRDVPAWQVDVMDFETYVKRVVPQEMPAGWSPEALRAQAVAARTYAWYFILRDHPNYDVNDTIAYQLMCDTQDPRTDAAVKDTRGQYVAYEGQPILAEYSSENSSPTVTRPGYPYLQAVDDPVSFGQTRIGHGRGMGQTGGARWAEDPFRWTYQQILGHYYSAVSVEAPAGPPGDTTAPIGALTLPWSGYYLTGNRALIRANASDESSGIAQADFSARYWDGTAYRTELLYRDTDGSDGWQMVWDLTGLPDQPLTADSIALTLTLRDATGNTAADLPGARAGLDRVPPTGALDIPVAASQTISVPMTLSGSDAAGGSGLAAMGFSNDWLWEEDALYRELIGGVTRVGQVIADGDALNGAALCGQAGVDPPGAWYGPYTTDLPPGHAYRAYFRLKTSVVTTAEEAAYLDVVDDLGATVLGVRRLRGLDFRQAGVYQEFGVDFDYREAGTAGLEFRTAFRGVADLCLDRVLIVSYPQPFASSTTWAVRDEPGWREVTGKLVDGAGNVSDDLHDRVYYLPPAIVWDSFQPAGWVTDTLTPTAQVVASASAGLDLSTAGYRFSRDAGQTWNSWRPASTVAAHNLPDGHVLVAPGVPFGQESISANWMQFRVTDLQGKIGFSPGYKVAIDTRPPTVSLQSPPLVTTPVFTVTWQGVDETSGLVAYDVQVRVGVDGVWQDWLLNTTGMAAAFSGERGQRYYFRARARDVAGNESAFAVGLGQASTLVSGQADIRLPVVAASATVPNPYPYPRPPPHNR